MSPPARLFEHVVWFPSGEMWPLLAVHGRAHHLWRHHRGDDLRGRAGWLGLQTLPDHLCKSQSTSSDALPRGQETNPPSNKIMSTLGLATLLPSRGKAHFQYPCSPCHGAWWDDVLACRAWGNGERLPCPWQVIQGNRRHVGLAPRPDWGGACSHDLY